VSEAVEVARGTAEPMRMAMARLVRVETHWLAGRDAEARADLLEVLPLADRIDVVLRGSLATWLRRYELPGDVPGPFLPAHAAALAGDFVAAERLWLELDCGYDAALALYDSGSDTGLRSAQARFDALGATAAVQATRREMRRRGLRPVRTGVRPGTRDHPAGLTAREHEILELLVSGRSNHAIAAELVISVKTVGHHVSAVLAKLGVPSRQAAAAEAVRRGLVRAS
jgi:DNA-binding CsgD family transcriptional regulator